MARFAQAAETMGDRGLPAESRSILLEVEEDGFAAEPCDARRRQRPRSWPRSGTGDGPGASAGFGLRTGEGRADPALSSVSRVLGRPLRFRPPAQAPAARCRSPLP